MLVNSGLAGDAPVTGLGLFLESEETVWQLEVLT